MNNITIISRCGTFSPFLSLVILFLALPSSFIVSGVKSSRLHPSLILNLILFPILFTYIYTDGLSIFSPCFLKCIQNNLEYLSDTEYYPSGNSNLSFHIGADILDLLLLYELLLFFHV